MPWNVPNFNTPLHFFLFHNTMTMLKSMEIHYLVMNGIIKKQTHTVVWWRSCDCFDCVNLQSLFTHTDSNETSHSRHPLPHCFQRPQVTQTVRAHPCQCLTLIATVPWYTIGQQKADKEIWKDCSFVCSLRGIALSLIGYGFNATRNIRLV